MKFIDESSIRAEAGKGGDGCLSFRREKFVEKGGPNGGDGGDGGSIYLIGDKALNTLVDFRFNPVCRAASGERGKGSNCTGKKGEDLHVRVPLGTSIYDEDTEEYLGDVEDTGSRLLIAQGGYHGLGNSRFKSSTNRAPRKTTPGQVGEQRRLRMELKLIADVGLLGLPNAGKSTLIRSVSAAKPKVADYPFTTMIPNLGVVSTGLDHSFVIADIPGLIEGAAEGAGLGVQFLKHLSRTRLLLHLVDIAPFDGSDPVQSIGTLVNELQKYSAKLAERERWLIFTKVDLLEEEEVEKKIAEIVDALGWQAPCFYLSAIRNQGTRELCSAVMSALEGRRSREAESQDAAMEETQMREEIREQVHSRSSEFRNHHKSNPDASDEQVDVHYTH